MPKSLFQKIFLGKTVLEKYFSEINGEITVVEDIFGQKEIICGGVVQTGPLVKKLWQRGIQELKKRKIKPKNCLILGLGGGNLAKIVSQTWPEAKIKGVEIDPQILEIGKKYFELEKIKNLQVLLGDALNTENYLSKTDLFDLILVDIYQGKEYPKLAEKKNFFLRLKKFLSKNGVAVFNRLSLKGLEFNLQQFYQDLSSIFPRVWIKKTTTNFLVFCQK